MFVLTRDVSFVLAREEDDLGFPGRAAGAMDTDDLFFRHGQHPIRIRRAQIVRRGKGKTLEVV